MQLEFLTADVPKLFPFMETVLLDGGKKHYALNGELKTFQNLNGYSGFEYNEGEATGTLGFGLILGGSGFALKRTQISSEGEISRLDYFDTNGELTFSADSEALTVLFVDRYEMDTTCPVLNHLYNFLSLEYKKAQEATSSTELVHSVETYLRKLYKSKKIRLSIQSKANDPAFTNIFNKILKKEMDPVLTWEERQLVFRKHRETMKRIADTKARAHRLSTLMLVMALFSRSCGNFLARVLARPFSNFQGILYRYTIGKVVWFFETVKNNLGYSVALAVYGPFTYYFITMPMNPHAMQAVGKVRSTYLDVKTEISRFMDTTGRSLVNEMDMSKEAVATGEEEKPGPKVTKTEAPATQEQKEVQLSDEVKIQNAAAKKIDNESEKANILANIIHASSVTTDPAGPLMVRMGNGRTQKYKPTLMNMLLATDVPPANKQSWFERMSNFKQMQIGYEENIEYASRMGRLEQLETQYNFPMQVESTWEELERYHNMIFKIREENPELSAKMKQYLFNEVNRTQQLQLYLWDRLARFILDQPYVMLDQDKEQKRRDYYVGRSFVFLQEITKILSWRYKDFKRPEGFEKIEKLSKFYEDSRKEYGSVLKNLEANSDLFKQKDIYDTKEFRSYMKRQWEILYLQNAKAEEAANMGLNMYIWSVRNTVWILQSIYSTKRDELAMLVKRDVTGEMFSPAENLTRSRMSMLYETFFHNLTLEYVGIREEISNRLGKDIESNQRMTVINNLKEFLTDRDKLDGVNVAKSNKTAGSTL